MTSQTDPAQNIKLVAKTDQNIGYLYQAQTPHQGMTAELWKNIYVDGELTDSVQVNSSYYQESPAIYEVGVVSSNQAAVSAMYTAIANNDLNQVQNIITYGVQQHEAPQTSSCRPMHHRRMHRRQMRLSLTAQAEEKHSRMTVRCRSYSKYALKRVHS